MRPVAAPTDGNPAVEAGRPIRSTRRTNRRLSTRFTELLTQAQNPEVQESPVEPSETATAEPNNSLIPQPLLLSPVEPATTTHSDTESDESSDSYHDDDSLAASEPDRQDQPPAHRSKQGRTKKNAAPVPASESLQGLAPVPSLGMPTAADTVQPEPSYGSLLYRGPGERAHTSSSLWQYLYPLPDGSAPPRVAITSPILQQKPSGPQAAYLGCRMCNDLNGNDPSYL